MPNRPLVSEPVEGSREPETLHPHFAVPGYFDGCPFKDRAANVQLYICRNGAKPLSVRRRPLAGE